MAAAVVISGALAAVAYVALPQLQVHTPKKETGVAGHHQSALGEAADAGPAVFPAMASAPTPEGYVRYSNERFHFVVDVPAELGKIEELPNGAGRTYTNAAGDASLTVTGGDVVGSLDDMYRAEYLVEGHERWILPMHTETADSFVVTGFDDALPFLIKGIATGGVFAKLHVAFSREAASHFEEILPHTRDSFRFTVASDTKPVPLDAGAASADDSGVGDAGRQGRLPPGMDGGAKLFSPGDPK